MRRPTYGSLITLNASAENGPFGSASRVISSSVPGTVPAAGSTSSGDGSRSTTASSSGWTPLFLNDEPQSTGVIVIASTAARMASTRRSFSISWPSR